MKAKKTVFILIDGSAETVKMAAGIASALKGNKVTVKSASEFEGNDILPAEAFFLGCGKPRPDSFVYVEDLFKHINLAGRLCGVFTPADGKAVKYLSSLLRDSEAAMNAEPFLGGSPAETAEWAQKVILGEASR